MKAIDWNRRQALKTGALAGVGALLSQVTRSRAAVALLPSDLIGSRISFVTTTEKRPWVENSSIEADPAGTQLELEINPSVPAPTQPIQGFGACFNELGWISLQLLKNEDQENILRELFDPVAGARFNYCRMPIGANDFSTEAYSYDETDGDFELQHFSIAHDRNTLIPFIHAAMRYQPHMRIWASPWTPPSWMKRNHFYAEAKARPGRTDNGIRPDQIGHEGMDFFLQEPRYFKAYAQYFGKFIDAYRAEGINIGMVMPQNEFNSAQNFPSCTWTPEGLARFLHDLGPEMAKRNVDIFFGTLERQNPKMLETALADPEAAQYIKGVGVQWAGKNALPGIHRAHPNLPIFQSEQECGDGKNDWAYTSYCWQLMKHYLRNGCSAYMYWNISLQKDRPSTWGWAQNSLVSVDATSKTFSYTNDYYLMKHLTHFVDEGAQLLRSEGTCDDSLAFRNPNGSIVALVRNSNPQPQKIRLHVEDLSQEFVLPGDSISTLAVRAN